MALVWRRHVIGGDVGDGYTDALGNTGGGMSFALLAMGATAA